MFECRQKYSNKAVGASYEKGSRFQSYEKCQESERQEPVGLCGGDTPIKRYAHVGILLRNWRNFIENHGRLSKSMVSWTAERFWVTFLGGINLIKFAYVQLMFIWDVVKKSVDYFKVREGPVVLRKCTKPCKAIGSPQKAITCNHMRVH